MTVTALILRDRFFSHAMKTSTRYLVLGTLFVNVSIGGALTPFAAPAIVMVAAKWGWTLPFMLGTFGSRVVLAVLLNAFVTTAWVWKHDPHFRRASHSTKTGAGAPGWLVSLHLGVLALVVSTAHHPAIFIAFFLFFIGMMDVTREFQDGPKLRESLLVAFFLAGLVVLGGMQAWWLRPTLAALSPTQLFFGATALTAVTDNAALTYLGSQVDLHALAKYALVGGAITGGGLTVIANAPNPGGFSILKGTFQGGAISPARLFAGALFPTAVAAACLWFL